MKKIYRFLTVFSSFTALLGINFQAYAQLPTPLRSFENMPETVRATSAFSRTAGIKQNRWQGRSECPSSNVSATGPLFQLFQQGLERLNDGDYYGAIALLDRAISADPFDAGLYTNRGIAFQKLGNYEEAIADYQRAINIDPDYGLAYLNFGTIHYFRKQYEEANNYFNSAIKRFNQDLKATSLCQLTDAVQQEIDRVKSGLAVAHNNRGDIRRIGGSWRWAIADYEQAMKYDPNNGKAYLNRGAIYNQLRNYQGAIDDFQKAIGLDPQVAPKAYNNIGAIFLVQNQLQNALRNFDQAVRLEPNNPDFLYNRGLAHLNNNNREGAREDFRRAAELYRQQENLESAQKSEDKLNTLYE